MDVSAQARGYLSLINANNRGQGISQAADYLQPVVDITDMLGIFTRTAVQSINPALPGAAPFTIVVATVPVGETWIVRGGGIIMVAGAGVWCMIQIRPPGLQGGGSLNPLIVPVSETVQLGATTNQVSAVWQYPDMQLEAGTVIEVYGATTGAGSGYHFCILYDRLRG